MAELTAVTKKLGMLVVVLGIALSAVAGFLALAKSSPAQAASLPPVSPASLPASTPPTPAEFIIAANYSGSISIIDASTDTVYGPFLEGKLGYKADGLFDVVVTSDGNLALVANFAHHRVYFVNVSNPLAPSLVATVTTPAFVEDIALSADNRFALTTDGGYDTHISTIDVSNRKLIYPGDFMTDGVYASAVAIGAENTVVTTDFFGSAINTLIMDANGELTFSRTYTYTQYLDGSIRSQTPAALAQQTPAAPENDLPYHSPHPVNIAISPDGRTVLVPDIGNYAYPEYYPGKITQTLYAIAVYQIVGPGELRLTGVITGMHQATQSIAFNQSGDKAYLSQNGGFQDPVTNNYPPCQMSVVDILGPGQARLSADGVASYPDNQGSQWFGVDTITIANGKAYVGSPRSWKATEFMQTVSVNDYSVIPLAVPWATGVARFIPGQGAAGTRYVATTGSDANNNPCTDPAAPCATITYALNQAFVGDTVQVASGTYTESGMVVNKNLTITGAGAETTIVQAAAMPNLASSGVFSITAGTTAVIQGLTIRFGNNLSGLGGGITNAGVLTLKNSSILSNTATTGAASSYGGGIYNAGVLTVTGSSIGHNRAVANPGFQFGGGIFNSGVLALQSSVVFNNTTGFGGSNGFGGGINNTGVLTVTDSIIRDHAEVADGGGIYNGEVTYNPHSTAPRRVTLERTTIRDNRASRGGGISTYRGSIFANGSHIDGNIAYGDIGGGIYNYKTGVTLVDSSLDDNTVSNDTYGYGGGIFLHFDGTLKLDHCSVSRNSAPAGGGIYSVGALNLTDSQFISNTARTGSGGAIMTSRSMTLINSLVLSNTARSSLGGGIYNFSGGMATVQNSLVAGNLAAQGGGIYNEGEASINRWIMLHNSTVSGNTATTGVGGGIYNIGLAYVYYSTVVSNTARGSDGGGIYNTDMAYMQGSLVASNHASAGPDCSGEITSYGYNLIGDTGGCTFTSSTGDITDPAGGALFGPLQDNGGPTFTHALPLDSPAVDQVPSGTNSCGTAPFDVDQRGQLRPFHDRCDIGAFELQAVPVMQLGGNGQPIASGSTTPAAADGSDFGEVQLGQYLEHSFTITSTGNTDLVLTADPYIALSGAGQFSVSLQPGSPVTSTLPNITTTFTLRFTPTSLGLKPAVVTIANNSAATPFTFAIQGTGIDTISPTVQIDSGPVSPTNLTTAGFSFSGADSSGGPVSFECDLDGGASPSWSACTSPENYPGLTEGLHTFQVRSKDPTGNTSTPAAFTWQIDLTAPTVQIDSHPVSPTNQTAAGFTFSGSDDLGGPVSFACDLDGGASPAWSACTSPKNYPGLADGDHTFRVRSKDQAGNWSDPASFTWMIETVAPPAPVILSPVTGSVMPFDGTNEWRRPVFSGTAEAGATVRLYQAAGDLLLCSTTADANGDWTCRSSVAYGGGEAPGAYATAADLAGNVSLRSAAVTISFPAILLLPLVIAP